MYICKYCKYHLICSLMPCLIISAYSLAKSKLYRCFCWLYKSMQIPKCLLVKSPHKISAERRRVECPPFDHLEIRRWWDIHALLLGVTSKKEGNMRFPEHTTLRTVLLRKHAPLRGAMVQMAVLRPTS